MQPCRQLRNVFKLSGNAVALCNLLHGASKLPCKATCTDSSPLRAFSQNPNRLSGISHQSVDAVVIDGDSVALPTLTAQCC